MESCRSLRAKPLSQLPDRTRACPHTWAVLDPAFVATNPNHRTRQLRQRRMQVVRQISGTNILREPLEQFLFESALLIAWRQSVKFSPHTWRKSRVNDVIRDF